VTNPSSALLPPQPNGCAPAAAPSSAQPAAAAGGASPAGGDSACGDGAGAARAGPPAAAAGGQAWPGDMLALLAGNPALASLLVSAAVSVGAPLYALAQGFANPAGAANPTAGLGVRVAPAAAGAAAAPVANGHPAAHGPGGDGAVSRGAHAAVHRGVSEDPQSPSPTAFKENEGRAQQGAAPNGAAPGGGGAAAQHPGGCSGVAGSGLSLGQQGVPGGDAPELFSPSQYLLKECR